MTLEDALKLAKEISSKHQVTFVDFHYKGSKQWANCLGSGTLIMLDQDPYILTAAHVIRALKRIRDEEGENGIFGWSIRHKCTTLANNIWSINLDLCHPQCEEGSGTYDIGLYPLDSNDIRYYKDVERRYCYHIDGSNSGSLSRGIYFLLGNPNSESQCYPSLKVAHFTHHACRIEQEIRIDKYGDPDGRGKNRAAFKVVVDAENPILDYGGMSGGGIWGLEGGIPILRGVASQATSDGVMIGYIPPNSHSLYQDLLEIRKQ